MTRRSPRQRGITYLTAALALLGLGLVSAAVISSVATPAEAHVDIDSALLVSTRDQLRVCVAQAPTVATVASGSKLASQVGGQLERAKHHPDFTSAFGRADRVSAARSVRIGCPSAKLPERAVTKGDVVGPGLTTAPSEFRTWIWVLDEATADRLLGPGRAAAVVSAERMRSGDQVVTVSTSLLVRATELGGAGIAEEFAGAIGLRPLTDPATLGEAAQK